MRKLSAAVAHFVRDESGLTSVEYAVAGALVILVASGAFILLGTNVNTQVRNIAAAVG